ncbi:MAG: monovalent cation/H(+) antiporter subunit G [Rickettsiales bacterium]|jgi:multisubunit Na+/H+ antiporter MnhG subunit|nr:monovalent cation/H(+) antiporter subunit G [Rickettsiales bacterium]
MNNIENISILNMISYFFFGFGVFVLFSTFIGFLRSGDYFIKTHIIKVSNIYGANFLILGIGIKHYETMIFIQILMLIILNTLITLLVSHALSRMAINNNANSDAINRKEFEKKKKQTTI